MYFMEFHLAHVRRLFAVLLLLYRDSASLQLVHRDATKWSFYNTVHIWKIYCENVFCTSWMERYLARETKHCFSNPGRMAQGNFVLWSHNDVGACWGFAAKQNL